jgi:hypothetical protein
LSGLQTFAGQLEYVRANMPVARDLASILDGGLSELTPHAQQLAAAVGVQRREDTTHYDRGYQAMHLLAEFARTGRQDRAAWQEHPTEFMARIRDQRAKRDTVTAAASAGPIITADGDTQVGYMLANEHAPADPDARVALFCLLAARDWGEVFDPRKLTGHDADPIEVVDDPEKETWRAPAEGEEPTHRWYVFNGLHDARVWDDDERTPGRPYPVTEAERSAVHAATHNASTAVTDTVPPEFWPVIGEMVTAARRQSALYAYTCDSRAELRNYIGIDGDGIRTVFAACDPSFPVAAAQVRELAAWAHDGEHPATIQLTSRPDGALYAVQGDDDVTIPRPTA